MSRDIRREISLVQYDDRQWSATDDILEVTVHGETKEGVLEQLDAEIKPSVDTDLAEQTEEDLEKAVSDILSNTEDKECIKEAIDSALEDLDERESDDDPEFTI
ncbi:hypothetical protein [Halorussus salinus]|uniref:hypothetical protein n=1 Tax=Halorussus salinus TaxID=1364935 RepID=UPI001092E43B|nr:hypothetical protein [Halorussus salinus]